MESEKLIASAARNLSEWHEASLKPLGIECHKNNGLWYKLERGPSIYVSGVTTAPAKDAPDQMDEIEKMVERCGNLSIPIIDSWAELDLTHLGFRRSGTEPWYIREPGPRPENPAPSGIVIEEVCDSEGLKEFEIATWDGFESNAFVRSVGLGGQHHPGTLKDPNMHYYVGRFEGKVVTSSIAQVSKDIVGVFGVSTLPDYRQRGFGEAITWAAVMAAPHLPAHLEPSEESASMYRKMGFHEIGHSTHWFRSKV